MIKGEKPNLIITDETKFLAPKNFHVETPPGYKPWSKINTRRDTTLKLKVKAFDPVAVYSQLAPIRLPHTWAYMPFIYAENRHKITRQRNTYAPL